MIFLIMRSYAPEQSKFMPLVSLLIGMFLKSGEVMINGIAARVFAAFQALIPTSMPASTASNLYTFVVTGLPPAPADRAVKFKALIDGLEAIKGVQRINTDAAIAEVRCDFDPQHCSKARIRQEVEFHGLRIV